MTTAEDLWRDFPKTSLEFELRFATEDACRQYLMAARWGGSPSCGKCGHKKVYELAVGRWECAACGHQTSITAGTPMEGTRKDLRLWFRAIWEVVSRKNGISAKDLQRVLGFGSYETAWTWLQKIRRCLVRTGREPLRGSVQIDEGFLGGRGERSQSGRSVEVKALIMVAAESKDGRIRLEHAPRGNAASAAAFIKRNVSVEATVHTDGGGLYNKTALDGRKHTATSKRRKARSKRDAVQVCHWTIANLKRWWLGTHHGAISAKHLQVYLDEFEFRHNRRKTDGVGRLAARVLENLTKKPVMTMRGLVDKTKGCQRYEDT